ncbi:MAG: PQQ-binding-like beta-propeller repeat protein, partial [Actinobacteria bacterium]|nr:PQQ-binding-like beta-propeller repeat protein [Actinomycetota bacterium]
MFAVCAAAVIALIVVGAIFLFHGGDSSGRGSDSSTGSGQSVGSSVSKTTQSSTDSTSSASTTGSDHEPSDSTTSTVPGINMSVRATAETSPEAFSITTKIFRGTTQISSFQRQNTIFFGPGRDYTNLEGIVTFRGNNYREGASYGQVVVEQAKLTTVWSANTGSVAKATGTGSWTGSGWTGQPLIVKWPADIKAVMNIKADKKAAPDLTEVIYPCLDGNIHFLDLKDGSRTRETIVSGGGPFKGTGSLYPDGTPLLFVGHGDNSPGKESVRSRLYSLIDQKLLYTFGRSKDPNAYRSFHAYDSSALFDVESDTIIEPGENGLLYTIRLNTQFDKKAGTLSISPGQAIKVNYTAPNYSNGAGNTPSTRWWGMEDSAVIWQNYLYVAENGGKFMCFDLNTMELIWVQDVLDDTNSTPIFEESPEDGTCYLYISTSLHITRKGAADPRRGGIPIWKIDAATGEIVWETPMYDCYTVSGVSGGVQATPVLGKEDIADLVIYAIARTPNVESGILVALDKRTGREVWSTGFDHYSWSSPLALYTPQGKSYIVLCDSIGNMFLLEGTTGKVLDSLNLGTNIEASP